MILRLLLERKTKMPCNFNPGVWVYKVHFISSKESHHIVDYKNFDDFKEMHFYKGNKILEEFLKLMFLYKNIKLTDLNIFSCIDSANLAHPIIHNARIMLENVSSYSYEYNPDDIKFIVPAHAIDKFELPLLSNYIYIELDSYNIGKIKTKPPIFEIYTKNIIFCNDPIIYDYFKQKDITKRIGMIWDLSGEIRYSNYFYRYNDSKFCKSVCIPVEGYSYFNIENIYYTNIPGLPSYSDKCWDVEDTHKNIKKYTIEEIREMMFEAIKQYWFIDKYDANSMVPIETIINTDRNYMENFIRNMNDKFRGLDIIYGDITEREGNKNMNEKEKSININNTYITGDIEKEFKINNVHFTKEATVVIWESGDKTIVRRHDDEAVNDIEKAIMAAYMKKILNLQKNTKCEDKSMDNILKLWTDKYAIIAEREGYNKKSKKKKKK